MSDFDKEAEREKLREKYERDQESREVAEKMSELLLQGATMTNAHCSECGDPIFRYDGQEFCASCEKPVDRGTGEEAANRDGDDASGEEDGDGGTEEATADSETIKVTSPSDGRVQFGGETDGADEHGTDAPADSRPDPGAPDEESAPRRDERRATDEAPSRRPPRRERAPEQTGGRAPVEADVSAARESLVRTLSRFSQRAENCEDPQRATEYLTAAREAAEALAALRR